MACWRVAKRAVGRMLLRRGGRVAWGEKVWKYMLFRRETVMEWARGKEEAEWCWVKMLCGSC